MSILIPPFLKPGDTIAIAATARSVTPDKIMAAVHFVEQKGFKVYIDPDLYRSDRQFAGTEEERAALFNKLLAMPEVKAIWCARGGYGSARMVDLIDFSLLLKQPKWVAGFSDITVLLNQIYSQCQMASLHSTMPVFMFEKENQDLDDVKLAVNSFCKALKGEFSRFDCRESPTANLSSFEGEVVGGNLSVLYSIVGSPSEVNWEGKILFIEDLDEYLYHVDRMLVALKRAGKLKGLKGLLVGSFISMNDHSIPFGYSVEEMILQHCAEYGYPIIFDVNAGHHLQNIALPFGVHAKFIDGILTFANS